MNIKPRYYIYSVFQAGENAELNKLRHLRELEFLKKAGVNYKELIGVYNGQAEYSVMVPALHKVQEHVQATCKLYNQECYLFSDANGEASLFNSLGDFICKLGKFKELTANEAKNTDHSFDVQSKRYFTYA